MNIENTKEHIRALSNASLPDRHKEYISNLGLKYQAKIIYDIGACTLVWAKFAKTVWPDAKVYLFDGTDTLGFLYEENNYEYNIGVLSGVSGEEVDFYQSNVSPSGNSFYKENNKHSWAADIYYQENTVKRVKTQTVDEVAEKRGFYPPDLVKIDVQGCEVDILTGMKNTLKTCKHLIVELQHIEYNIGAYIHTYSIPFIESLGFKLVTPLFCNNGPDGDYHFLNLEL